MKQRIFIIAGTCIVIAGLGAGLVFIYQKHDSIKPVADRVGNSTSQTASGSVTVGNSSADSLQQATTTGSSSTNSTATANDSSSEITQMTNPSTFSQYNASKYADGNSAFFVNLQTGTGQLLSQSGQKAVVTYKGWLTNGTLFDETKVNAQGQSEAFEFTYGANPEQVIPGFDEGVNGMKVGGTRLIIVPPAAGYGSTAHNTIPANSVLVFEVTLDEIQ